MLIQSESFQYLINIKRVVAEICACFNVFLYVKVGYKIVHLEYVAKMLSAIFCQRAFIHIFCLFTVYGNITRVSVIYSAYDVKKCGFAASRRAEKNAELTLFYANVYSFKYLYLAFPAAIAFSDIVYFNKQC